MPDPASLISVSVILCEKVLFEEAHQAYSAVRMADVFYFRRNPDLPLDSQAIPISILVMGKSQPEDNREHSVQLVMVRPNGEAADMGEPLRAVFQATLKGEGLTLLAEGSSPSDIAGGFAIRAEVNVVPRIVGRHQINVMLDGELVARAPFTILELKSQTAD